MKNVMYEFIVNPAACSGRGTSLWKQVERILEEENIEYHVHIPKSRTDVIRLCNTLTKQPVHLVILGGDGTLNAVLQGISDFENTVLSCIRTGSGNDFARNMKISGNMQKKLRHILYEPEEHLLDYGEATYEQNGELVTQRFLISCGIGYDADICEEVSRSRLKQVLNKVHLGKLVYVAIGIKQIFSRRSPGAVITMDDAEGMTVPKMFFSVGMLHEMEGGGVPFCPDADPVDGMFDVCLVQGMSKIRLLLAVMLVYFRKHTLFREITLHRCRRLHIRTQEYQWFHIDGDTPCRVTELTLQCRSGLRFVK